MKKPCFILYIIERHPVLTQTFLRREMAGLAEQGLRIEIYSLLPPPKKTDGLFDANEAGAINVHYFSWRELFRLPLALPHELMAQPGWLRSLGKLLRENRFTQWENFWATLWAGLFAILCADKIRRLNPAVIHGVRATGPATAAALLARFCRRPYTFGAHAYDIYRHGGDAFLKPKLASAALVHTTTQMAADYLGKLSTHNGANILLVRRGINGLPAAREIKFHQPLRILSVGRLTAKKNHAMQLAACLRLKSDNIPFQLRIIGDGPLRSKLKKIILRLNLTSEVTLSGALSPAKTETEYLWADLFLHTGTIDAEGDRDGLPNVIPEAMAHGLPVVSTQISGAMEAIEMGKTGWLVADNNAIELATAVKALMQNEQLCATLGRNARDWVTENFMVSKNSALLADSFRHIAHSP